MTDTEIALDKAAASMLRAAKKYNHMIIGRTTAPVLDGRVELTHVDGVYTLTGARITPACEVESVTLAKGGPKDVRPVLASYLVAVEG